MDLGLKIKKLRLEQEWTQEQLAEMLGVSIQAVSRWENSQTYPDISLLPAIASIFEVSVDSLLGVDVYQKNEKISKILEEDHKLANLGKTEQRIELLRNALMKYPDSYVLQNKLVSALLGFYYAQDEKRDYILDEIIIICERILKRCIDDDIRYSTLQSLCFAYDDKKQSDKAIEIACKMPHRNICRENLLALVLQGDELIQQTQENMHDLIYQFYNILWGYQKITTSPLQLIEICHKFVDFVKMILGDNNYGFNYYYVYQTYMKITRSYAKLKNTEETFKNIFLAFDYIKAFENRPEQTKYEYWYLDKIITKKSDSTSNVEYNDFDVLLSNLEKSDYDFIRNDNRFKELINQIKNQ